MVKNSVLFLIAVLVSLSQARQQLVIASLPPSYRDAYSRNVEWRTRDQPALKIISSPSESEYETLVKYVSNSYAFNPRENVEYSEVDGVVGDVGSRTASILHILASRFNLSLTLVPTASPTTSLPVTDPVLPSVLDMWPLAHYTEAVVSFIDQWNWTRIGLISDTSNYYRYAAETLHNKILQGSDDRIVIPSVTVTHESNSFEALNTVKEYGTHVIVVAMDSACSLLEASHALDMTWPDYAWITLSQKVCKTEGTFTLRELLSQLENDSLYGHLVTDNIGNRHCTQDSTCRFLHDALLAVSLTTPPNDTATRNLSFTGATGLVQFREGKRLTNISILQVLNGSSTSVANYNTELQKLHVIRNLLEGRSPEGGTRVVRFGEFAAHPAVVVTLFIIVFSFLTVVFILYVYFRNEPEIKATSVSVSLCMYLSCYLMLMFEPFLVIVGERFNAPICMIQVALSAFGFPTSLILTTLFVKMLRVYIIFYSPFHAKTIFLRDMFLLLFIVLLEVPSVLILLLWFTIDPVEIRILEVPHKDHLGIFHRCFSEHTIVWVSLQFSYIGLLILAVVILGFKSSEIRYRNFRDTKATNAYTYVLILLTFLIITYWWFFRSLGPEFNDVWKSYITLYTGHFILPIVCQVFLFIPKVYYPLRRHLFKGT